MGVSNQPATSKGVNTRERVLVAAHQMLVARGFERFVMRELAETLGMTLGNLQYYFKTRELLILAVIEAEAAQDVATIERRLQSGGDARACFWLLWEI